VAVSTRTLLEVVRLSTTFLAQHGSASARLDAELLAAHALQLRRIDLYLQFDRPLRNDELESVREMVRRRGHGEPVAYITGVREFYGREFAVSRDVLIPRPETETLVQVALDHIRAVADGRSVLRVADLGTGSGCIAVTLACELPEITVIATDLSGAALRVAQANASRHGVSERVTFVEASWADAVEGPLDVVVSNPPYVTDGEFAQTERDVHAFEPETALLGGEDGLRAYRALLDSIRDRTSGVSAVFLEVDPRRAAAVLELAQAAIPGSSAELHADLTGRARVAACVKQRALLVGLGG
jgi:release factor glutamine methyltransferase